MEASAVLAEIRAVAEDAQAAFREKRTDHGERANKATGIIDRYLKSRPRNEDRSALLETLTRIAADQPTIARTIYEAAIRRLDKKPELSLRHPKSRFEPKPRS